MAAIVVASLRKMVEIEKAGLKNVMKANPCLALRNALMPPAQIHIPYAGKHILYDFIHVLYFSRHKGYAAKNVLYDFWLVESFVLLGFC